MKSQEKSFEIKIAIDNNCALNGFFLHNIFFSQYPNSFFTIFNHFFKPPSTKIESAFNR